MSWQAQVVCRSHRTQQGFLPVNEFDKSKLFSSEDYLVSLAC